MLQNMFYLGGSKRSGAAVLKVLTVLTVLKFYSLRILHSLG